MSENVGAIKIFEATFNQKPLGLILSYRHDKQVAIISGFEWLAASLDGALLKGDEIIACAGINVDGFSREDVANRIRIAACPITLRFRRRLHGVNSSDSKLISYSFLDNANNKTKSILMNESYNIGDVDRFNGNKDGCPLSSNENDEPTPPIELNKLASILHKNVANITQVTNDIYNASLHLDKHNHVRHQATVITAQSLIILPTLINKVDELVDIFKFTVQRLDRLESILLPELNKSSEVQNIEETNRYVVGDNDSSLS